MLPPSTSPLTLSTTFVTPASNHLSSFAFFTPFHLGFVPLFQPVLYLHPSSPITLHTFNPFNFFISQRSTDAACPRQCAADTLPTQQSHALMYTQVNTTQHSRMYSMCSKKPYTYIRLSCWVRCLQQKVCVCVYSRAALNTDLYSQVKLALSTQSVSQRCADGSDVNRAWATHSRWCE